MKVQISIGHPAHVHLFKNIIWNLQRDGHEVKIVARNKDVTLDLLNSYNFEYEVFPKYRSNLLSKAIDRILVTFVFYKIAKKFKPDLLMGIAGVAAAQVGKIIGKPSIIITDTEHASLSNAITLPFATVICTPSCFKKNLGPKQIRYNGYHELAYLHPDYFTPDPSVLDELRLKESERFIILRFVSWNASHDIGHKGIDIKMRQRFVSELEKYGKVLITSEGELPAELEPHRIKVAPEKMHDLLYYAALYVGEGGTMASEAAILGTPSIYISSLVGTMGNFEELEEKYDLMKSFREPVDALATVHSILKDKNSKNMWQKRKDIMLSEKVDVTKFIVKIIEKYGSVVGE